MESNTSSIVSRIIERDRSWPFNTAFEETLVTTVTEERKIDLSLLKSQAIENLVKNNRRLKQISYSRKTAVYTIQRHSLLEIVKALQRLDNKYETFAPIKKQTIRKATRIIDKELLTPLEETRLAIEEIIIPNHKILDLLPRTSSVRKLQRDLVADQLEPSQHHPPHLSRGWS